MCPEFISLKYIHFQIQIKIYIKLDSGRGAQNGGNRTYTVDSLVIGVYGRHLPLSYISVRCSYHDKT